MRLTLSQHSPTNSVYRNQDGTPLYRVETPFKLVDKISTISRFVPNTGTAHVEPVAPVRSDNDSDTDIHLMRLEEEEVAQIHWHRFGDTMLKLGERTVSVGEYMPRMGFSALNRRKRNFTASDGRSYRWTMEPFTTSLALNDESKTPIARYHRRLIGLVVQTYKAYLEIFPEGEAIVDEIVITFIYVEMLRRMENGERL